MTMTNKQKTIVNIAVISSVLLALISFIFPNNFLILKAVLAGTSIFAGVLWQIDKKGKN